MPIVAYIQFLNSLLTSTFKNDPYLISAFTPASTLLTLETIWMRRRSLTTNSEKEISCYRTTEVNNILPRTQTRMKYIFTLSEAFLKYFYRCPDYWSHLKGKEK